MKENTAPLDPAALLPPDEEMAPDTPTDALGRYVALLMRWDVLSQRQALYAETYVKLEELGAQLAHEWSEVRTEYDTCLAALQACPLPLDAAIREVWMLYKTHLYQLVEPDHRFRGVMPEVLRDFLANRSFHPLGQQED